MTDINWWKDLKEKSSSLADVSLYLNRFVDILDNLRPITSLIQAPSGELEKSARKELFHKRDIIYLLWIRINVLNAGNALNFVR